MTTDRLCECGCGETVNPRRRFIALHHFTVTKHPKRTHGLSKTPEYRSWNQMRRRCLNPRSREYRYYGGRGITVCPQWSDFETFLSDMGKRPDLSYSLDRIDNHGNYEPSNCRWANQSAQNFNRRVLAPSRLFTWRGETLSTHQWAKRVGMSPGVVTTRLHRGWSFERAITTPVRPIRRTGRGPSCAAPSAPPPRGGWSARCP